jgi:hypothetical protein
VEGCEEMTQAGVRSAILIPNRGVLFLVTVIRLMITGLTSYRKGKEPTNMEIAAITPATLILLTTRYETHHVGSLNPCSTGAPAVRTMLTESHYRPPVAHNLLPLLLPTPVDAATGYENPPERKWKINAKSW